MSCPISNRMEDKCYVDDKGNILVLGQIRDRTYKLFYVRENWIGLNRWNDDEFIVDKTPLELINAGSANIVGIFDSPEQAREWLELAA